MDGTAIIIILAIAGVVSVLLFAVKGILDQLPDLFDSAGRARDAWDQLTKKNDDAPGPAETEEPPPVLLASDEEPPAAA